MMVYKCIFYSIFWQNNISTAWVKETTAEELLSSFKKILPTLNPLIHTSTKIISTHLSLRIYSARSKFLIVSRLRRLNLYCKWKLIFIWNRQNSINDIVYNGLWRPHDQLGRNLCACKVLEGLGSGLNKA